jgi:hypothetical protein
MVQCCLFSLKRYPYVVGHRSSETLASAACCCLPFRDTMKQSYRKTTDGDFAIVKCAFCLALLLRILECFTDRQLWNLDDDVCSLVYVGPNDLNALVYFKSRFRVTGIETKIALCLVAVPVANATGCHTATRNTITLASWFSLRRS